MRGNESWGMRDDSRDREKGITGDTENRKARKRGERGAGTRGFRRERNRDR